MAVAAYCSAGTCGEGLETKPMKTFLWQTRFKLVSVALLLFGLSESFAWAGEAFISKVPDSSGSFCHLKFPAIRDDTLFSDRPVLKDPSEGDIIDFYGPCNYDPLGRESILRQRYEHRLRRRKEYGSD
jgi:hypothetical protein